MTNSDEIIAHDNINNMFTYHAPNPNQILRYQLIRDEAKQLGHTIINCCPSSRERSAAITLLQNAVMMANASIAVNEKDVNEETGAGALKKTIEEIDFMHKDPSKYYIQSDRELSEALGGKAVITKAQVLTEKLKELRNVVENDPDFQPKQTIYPSDIDPNRAGSAGVRGIADLKELIALSKRNTVSPSDPNK